MEPKTVVCNLISDLYNFYINHTGFFAVICCMSLLQVYVKTISINYLYRFITKFPFMEIFREIDILHLDNTAANMVILRCDLTFWFTSSCHIWNTLAKVWTRLSVYNISRQLVVSFIIRCGTILTFQLYFQKIGATNRKQVVNPRYQTPQRQSIVKPGTLL